MFGPGLNVWLERITGLKGSKKKKIKPKIFKIKGVYSKLHKISKADRSTQDPLLGGSPPPGVGDL